VAETVIKAQTPIPANRSGSVSRAVADQGAGIPAAFRNPIDRGLLMPKSMGKYLSQVRESRDPVGWADAGGPTFRLSFHCEHLAPGRDRQALALRQQEGVVEGNRHGAFASPIRPAERSANRNSGIGQRRCTKNGTLAAMPPEPI